MLWFNGNKLNFTKFPNGETKFPNEQIKGIERRSVNNIEFKYESDDDLIKLMLLKLYLDERKLPVSLTLSYLPYSRMDRSENDSAFTLKYVTNFINSLFFESVIILEPHSDVSPALIDNVSTVFPTSRLLEIAVDRYKFDKKKDYLFFPDGGASKRYGKVSGFKQLVGNKVRDFESGQLKSLQVIGDVQNKGFKAIILDDLCSRGGTFMLSAEKLREIGASEIYLVVTHCEETIYDGDIFKTDLIDEVLTTNTIVNEVRNKKIHIIDWRNFV